MKKILVSILVIFLLCGCSSKLTVTTIDGVKAHEMYLEGAILLDVRTMEEYMEYHLEMRSLDLRIKWNKVISYIYFGNQ